MLSTLFYSCESFKYRFRARKPCFISERWKFSDNMRLYRHKTHFRLRDFRTNGTAPDPQSSCQSLLCLHRMHWSELWVGAGVVFGTDKILRQKQEPALLSRIFISYWNLQRGQKHVSWFITSIIPIKRCQIISYKRKVACIDMSARVFRLYHEDDILLGYCAVLFRPHDGDSVHL
jgi:hypothetical protein